MNLILTFLLSMNQVTDMPVFKPYVMREPVIIESLNVLLREMGQEIEIIKANQGSRRDIEFELFHLNKNQDLLRRYYQELQKKFKHDREFLTKKGGSQKFLSRLDEVENNIAQKMDQLKSAINGQKFDEVLTLIKEALPPPPPVDSHPFYQKPEQREPVEPAPAGKDLRTGFEPDSLDTLPTLDVQITSLIRDLAQDLNYDPRKIYEYVKNNIAYHPYFGSMKGSVGTLYEKSGNDCDQVSLLLALLRASSIPCRYRRGLIYLPVEDALKLFGVLEPKRVQEILITTGIPHKTYSSGSNIVGFDIEFFWVIAYLPIKHYMGIPTGDRTGCAWIPMLPALKFVNCVPGINIPKAMSFSCDSFLKQCIVDSVQRIPLEIYRENLTDYLYANYPGSAYEDILLKVETQTQFFPTLPLTSPITIKYLISEYSDLPKSLRHRLSIAVGDDYGYYYFAIDTLALPLYFGKNLTLSWEPTQESQSIIQQYGGLYQTPAYLIDLMPTLWLGGVPVIQGEATGAGGYRTFFFNILTYDPNSRYSGLLFNVLAWGASAAILVNQDMTDFYITHPMQDSLDIPTSIARYLHKNLLEFALSVTKDEDEIARTLQLRSLRNIAFDFHQVDNEIWYMWNYPLKSAWTGLIYSGSIIETPVPVSTEYGRDIFFFLAGLNADAKIKESFEQQYGILAFSTLKGTRVAHQLGVPIYQISDYGNTIIPYIGGPPGGASFPGAEPSGSLNLRVPPHTSTAERSEAKPNTTPKSAIPEAPTYPPTRGIEPSGSPFAEGELIIKLSRSIPKDQITQSISTLKDAQILKQSTYSNAFLLKLPKSQNLQSTISNLQSNPLVEYAEPNYRYYAQGSPSLLVPYLFSLTPTDPFYENQWAIRKCLFTATWDSTTGDSNLILAILDSGVDTLHPDLKNRVVLGYDFVNEDSFPVDDNGHGTQIAGVIGAQANNGVAIAGCDWQSKLLILKVLDIAGMGDAYDIAQAIYYAVSHNARIINMSFGSYDNSQVIAEAVQYAYNANCVLVAAAGNDATSLPFYPAAYPDVIGVSATKENDLIAEFSNWGDYVDFAAPGDNICTANKGGSVIITVGTSFSCAFVSGAASLILSKDPTLTNQQVYDKLKSGAELMGSRGSNPQYGWGRINPYYSLFGYPGVLLQVTGHPVNDFYNPPGNNFGTPEAGDSLQIRLWVFNYGDSTATNVSAVLSTLSPYVSVVEPYVIFPTEGIPGHHQSLSENLLKIYFHKDMPKGSIVPFTVGISSNQGGFVDGFNIREGDLLSVLELSEIDKYIINVILSFGCRVIVPSRYLYYDYNAGVWDDYAYEYGSEGRSAYFGVDPLDNGLWFGGGLDWHANPMSWYSLTPLNQWPPQWRHLFQQGREVAVVPEILEPLDSMVYHRGDTIDFRVQWTMTYGGGIETWIDEYKINSGDYPPGMHTFKAEGWNPEGPAYDSVSLCIFDFYIRENLVKKYFNPLKPDSARIVYALLPQRYADPDSSPNPLAFQVEIKDKDENLVYGPRLLTYQEQKSQVLWWDGRDNLGDTVNFDSGPFTVKLNLRYREGRQAPREISRITSVNTAYLYLLIAGPNEGSFTSHEDENDVWCVANIIPLNFSPYLDATTWIVEDWPNDDVESGNPSDPFPGQMAIFEVKNLPPAPDGRGGPLKYRVTATVDIEGHAISAVDSAKQDNKDDLRQEYLDVEPRPTEFPARTAFDQSMPSYARLLDFGSGDLCQRHQWWIVAAINGHAVDVDNTYTGNLYITSGYRCPVGNRAAGGVANSRHMYGRAFDYGQGSSLENFRVAQAVDANDAIENLLYDQNGNRWTYHRSWQPPPWFPDPSITEWTHGHAGW